jgi:hypothetical protein
MASITLGRVVCPIGCGHQAAQVKLKTDKGEKTAYPYVHCAGCGIQLHTRNDEQGKYLLKGARPEKGAAPEPIKTALEAPKEPEATHVPPEHKKAPGGLFGGLFGGVAA